MSSSGSSSVVRFLWVWSLISWHSPTRVSAIRCGTAISKDCLGDDDVRYDDSVGYDLADHAPVFRAVPGFYKSVNTFYTPDGHQAPALPSGGEFFQNPYIEFINVTVDGTRYYQHNYGIFQNINASRPGGALLFDSYYVATFEKAGTARGLSDALPTALRQDGSGQAPSDLQAQTLVPLNNRAWYASFGDEDSFSQETWLCWDDDCQTFSSTLETFDTTLDTDATHSPVIFLRYSGNKLESAEEWLSEISKAAMDANVPDDALPADVAAVQCATGSCPTEEQWEKVDPNFQESPYEEPDGALKPGFIAGITVAAVVICGAIVWIMHRSGLARQEQRIRTAVARAVASTMGPRRRAESLTPMDLEKHFDSLDRDGDGYVTKSEVKDFLETSSVAELDDKDFQVLFATLDLNHDDKIDFTEFCAFFAIIRNEYNQAILQKSVLQARPSYIPASKSSFAKSSSMKPQEEENENAAKDGEGVEAEAKSPDSEEA